MSTTFRRTRGGVYVPRGPVGYRANVLADSPAAFWRFSETSGTSVADSSGGGHTGGVQAYNGGAATSYTRNVTGLVTGDTDPAIGLTGNGDQVVATRWWTIAAVTAYTFECIFKVSDTGQRPLGCVDDVGNSSQMIFRVETTGGRITAYTYQGTTLKFIQSPVASVPLNTKMHVAVVYTNAATIEIFLNGTSVATGVGTTSFAPISTSPYRVGGFGASGAGFNGTLDEAALYLSALSPTRIAAHAAAV